MDGKMGQDGLEREIAKIYDKYRHVAAKFGYTYKRSTVSLDGLPSVLFAGNHSSGKSTFINSLLGGTPVQDTGVAPTDDGFTVLLYGEKERDVAGQAALALLPKESAGLSALGPNFLQRLRVKIRNRAILKKAVLIDSPGMIDTTGKTVSRDYDFFAALHNIAEICDLIILMFDPDKPGTTGESVAALSGPLAGMTFKLRILMNKCDLFASMYDYARAYGALCWNLAHVLPIKDLPKVYTCFVPQPEKLEKFAIDVSDFDRLRGEITRQIENASESRNDNVLAAVHKDLSCLSLQIRMILRICKALSRCRFQLCFLSTIVTLLAAMGGILLFYVKLGLPMREWSGGQIALVYGVVIPVTLLIGWGLFVFCRFFLGVYTKQLLVSLDEQFKQEYADELAVDTRDDLLQYWELVKPSVEGTLAVRWRKMPCHAWGVLRQIEASQKKLS